MWFAFGLITLALGFIVSLIARTRAGWKGEKRGGHGEVPAYECQRIYHKKRLMRVRVGMPAPKGLQFRVRKERWHDGFFKAIGISVEMQVQDPVFDDTVYLESDVEALGLLLAQSAEIRSAIVGIFRHAEESFKSMVMRCSHGRIWVEFAPRGTDVGDAADRVARNLGVLAKALATHRAMLEQQKDPFVNRAIVVLSISTATAVLGVYGLLRGGTGRTDILDAWQLFFACVVPGFVALAGFIALIIAYLGRSSRTHLVLIETFFVGGAGFVLGLFALARELNIEFDTQPAQSIELTGVHAEHKVTRGRRGRRNHHYYLHAQDWRENKRGRPVRLEISSASYQQLVNARSVFVRVKPGLLGFEWVEAIHPRRLE